MGKDKQQEREKNQKSEVQNSKDELEDANEKFQADQQEDSEVDFDTLIAEEKAKRVQLMADFENYRKRMETEKATFGAITNISLIQDILEVFDDLQLAIQDEALDLDRAKNSMTNAQNKLTAATAKSGVEKIDISVGDDFDKDSMEAISTVPNPKMKDKVIAIISSAYKYSNKDGILKPAKVIVGK